MVKVLFVNNLGGGFADYVEVARNTTVEKFLDQKMPGCRAEDYLIRVNRLPAARNEILRDGDRITVTPLKIDGARSLATAA